MDYPHAALRSISSLLDEKFFIPSYQRGYRWTEIQVTELLDDLWQFQRESDSQRSEHFYCLQPLVIKARKDGSWEVVDGQQRLTTIYLILAAEKQRLELIFGKNSFELAFETRAETSESFLKHIQLERAEENIDFYHISKAYEAIRKWFSSRDGSQIVKLLQTLLNDDVTGKNTKVIWYQLPESEDPIEAFTRLNIGKIPLTNSELIRALFLQAKNFGTDSKDLRQIRIAQEWDLIEKTLQAPDFWYFVHSGENTPANRIEYLFELMTEEAEGWAGWLADAYHSFDHYNRLLKEEDRDAESEWLEIKKLFMMLEEWFRDRTLYHLTGFLIHVGVSITDLRREALSRPKSSFDRFLRQRILKQMFGEPRSQDSEGIATLIDKSLTDLDYGSSKGRLRSVLLLFNIVTLLENNKSNLRFPFDSFKIEEWDIEHIRSVESDRPDRPDAQKSWLEGVKQCYEDTHEKASLRGRIEEVIASRPFNKQGFNEIYDEIIKVSGEAESSEADHRLENLTLLDQGTNRSYKNAVFPVKRHRILSLDKSGIFVPLCTRNVFLKCYSADLDKMEQWRDVDKSAYRKQVLDVLCKFFNPKPQA
jgi:hypothetical protein